VVCVLGGGDGLRIGYLIKNKDCSARAHTHTHIHTVLMTIFPGEPELASCPLASY